ncbi:MAG: cysteine desulfurase family protein [Armatimonadota bacterium]
MTIYLDHNATTPLRPEVWDAMASVEFGHELRGNPSSVHRIGVATMRTMAAARHTVASILGAGDKEIIFTGGGSEAINLALQGAVRASDQPHPHLVSTAVEHHAVLHALDCLAGEGCPVTLCPVDVTGRVDPQAIADAITPDTLVVSVMFVNNEVGTIQPVQEIGAICRERGVLFHIDAVQAVGKLPVNVADLQCDLLSFSAHKFNGPQGVGGLYVREGTPLAPLVHGGPQEWKLRAGTQNIAGIVGLAEALRLAEQEREGNLQRWRELCEILYRLPHELEAVRVNSHPDLTLPNVVNMTFMYCDGMTLCMNLSMRGICVSTSSACTAGDLSPSHVLKAMGLSDLAAHGAVRFSMGRLTTAEEIEATVEVTKEIVTNLRLVTHPDDIGKCGDDCPCFLTG